MKSSINITNKMQVVYVKVVFQTLFSEKILKKNFQNQSSS